MIDSAATSPVNHLHLMATGDSLSRFWSDCLGKAADRHEVLFAIDFIRRHGSLALYAKIDELITENNASVLLIDVSASVYDPYFILELQRKRGLVVVLFAIDDEFVFDWISSSYASIADLVLTTDHPSVGRYRQAGIDAHFFPLPIEVPHSSSSATPPEPKYQVSFVGRVDDGKPSRAAFARYLESHGVAVTYFGSRGEKDPAFLSRDDMNAVFSDSAINLSFAGITTYLDPFENVLHDRIRGYKIRPMEIMAAGGFCISEYSVSLGALFEDGVDIAFFRSKAQLLERIRYYLARPDEARCIAAAGAKKIAEQFSVYAVSGKLTELVRGAREHAGMDLYGEPHRVRVSRAFAATFIVNVLSNGVTLAARGRARVFLSDVRGIIRFMKRMVADIGTIRALQLAVLSVYRLGKDVLAKARH